MCNKNLTGGDFLGGVPKEVFDAKNPCGMQAGCGQACAAKADEAVGEAGDRAVLEQVTLKPVPAVHPDDIDALQQQQTVEARAQVVG